MKVQRCPERMKVLETILPSLRVSNSRGYLTSVVKNASSSEMRAKLEHVCVKEEFQLE